MFGTNKNHIVGGWKSIDTV